IQPDPQSAQEGAAFDFDVSQFFSDPDGDTLTFSASGLPGGLSITAAGQISGTPAAGTAAQSPYAVTVQATDGSAAQPASDSFTLNVTGANAPPTLPASPPRLETEEDTPLTITADMLGAVDEDVGSLAVVLTPPGAGANYTLSGDATVVPAGDFNGALTVEARVRDSEHTSNAVNVTIDVTPVNDAPRIESIPPQSATESTPFSFDAGAYVSDAEGDPLQYSASGLPAGLSIDAATGTVTGTIPAGTEARDYDVGLTVDDGSDSASASFVISLLLADRADLEASVDVAPNPAIVDETATWTLTVRNAGGVDVANVTLDAQFTGDTPYRLDPLTDASCSLQPSGNVANVSCRWGPLAGGESMSVDVAGRASEVGQIETVVTVAIADAVPIDETSGNDTARVVLEVTERLSGGPVQELTAPGAVAAAAADFDGDGIHDIAVATGAGEPTLIFLNVADPDDENKRAFSPTPISAGEPTAAAAVAAADIDGDGNADVVVANTDGPNHILFNAGSASFEAVALEDAAGGASRGVAIADVDGDSLLDVVFANEAQNAVHRNLGSRQFAAAEAAGAGPSSAVAAADVGRDGLPELIFANAGADAAILRRAGTGWEPAATLASGAATAVAAGNFDSDDAPDLAIGTAAEDPVFLNTSGGGALSFFLTDELGASATAALLIGDFDDDGRNDILEIGAAGTHRLYKNSGAANTTFSLHPEQFAGNAATGATLGLFDADDRPDVAVAGGGVVAIFLNDGRGNFGIGNTGAPQLTLNGEPTVTVTVGDEYADAGASATDDLDGDLTEQIVVDNPVDTDVIGTYTVTYSVVDSAGNRATLTRTVEVQARSGSGGGGGGAAGIPLLLLALVTAWIRRIRSGR
ncbi:MAG: VCBS repeat-containing protein, partial [Gammaproteobacteria bacterium]|nr:VCBS repeat-containing protein [Gammaproteobacteria bacterium]